MMLQPNTGDTSFSAGLTIREKVMGHDHVQSVLQNASEFSRPIQELVTEFAWGKVWTRPGLDLRTRSLLNIAMLTALNRNHELAGHVRGALNNGATEKEIQEVLIQALVYCGAPAALESFRVAEQAIACFKSNSATTSYSDAK